RSLVYASAGHPAGYILDAAGAVKTALPRTGVPLGIQTDTEYVESQEFHLATGDIVLLLTDGIEESMSPDNSLFGIERILEVVRANRNKPARDIVTALYQKVRQFSQDPPQLDDVTAIVVKVIA